MCSNVTNDISSLSSNEPASCVSAPGGYGQMKFKYVLLHLQIALHVGQMRDTRAE